jgi:hypothetical protein
VFGGEKQTCWCFMRVKMKSFVIKLRCTNRPIKFCFHYRNMQCHSRLQRKVLKNTLIIKYLLYFVAACKPHQRRRGKIDIVFYLMLSRAKNDEGKANERLMNDIKFNLISHRFQLLSALHPIFYRE